MLSAKEVAARAAKALDAKMGEDIRLIGITDISTLADYFLICTATSSTHVKTLCDAVEETMDEAGEPMLSREGHRGGTWVLMDFGSLVVHVFTAEARKFYDLERLWPSWAKTLDKSAKSSTITRKRQRRGMPRANFSETRRPVRAGKDARTALAPEPLFRTAVRTDGWPR